MKIIILIYQIIQEKFAYGELFMLVMIGYIFMFKMVKKNAKFRFRNSSWVHTPLTLKEPGYFDPSHSRRGADSAPLKISETDR